MHMTYDKFDINYVLIFYNFFISSKHAQMDGEYLIKSFLIHLHITNWINEFVYKIY